MQALLIVHGPTDPLRVIAGLTLLRRAILTARSAGAARIVVAVADRARLERLSHAEPDATYVLHDDYLTALDPGDDPVLITSALRVHDRRLGSVIASGTRESLKSTGWLDNAGADAQIYLMPRRQLSPGLLGDLASRSDLAGLGARFRAAGGLTMHSLPAKFLSAPVIDDRSAERAEDLLWQSCRKEADGAIAGLLNRPISLSISRRIAHLPITPNHISLFCIAVGLVASWLAAMGTYASMALGALLLHVSAVLDGVDGELARTKFAGSKFGEFLDSVGDDLINFTFYGGLSYAMFALGQPVFGWLGVLCLVCWTGHLAFTYASLRAMARGDVMLVRQELDSIGHPLVQRVIAFLRYKLLRRDVFVVATLLLALCDRNGWTLAMMFVGAAVAFAAVAIHFGLTALKRIGLLRGPGFPAVHSTPPLRGG